MKDMARLLKLNKLKWFCGGCGETNESKRCLGCRHNECTKSSRTK